MTALRQRMIEDMQVRNYSPRTVEAYVAAVAKLARHFQRSPDQLAGEEVRAFQVHLLAAKVPEPVVGVRPHLEVADVIRSHGEAFLNKFGSHLSATQKKALRDLTLYAKDWVVYSKPPFGGPEQVLKYLARYTHRVALSNHRLVKLAEGKVTFRYRDYAEARKEKLLTLSAEEFLRRFVQHVLPKGFMKIRHYGLLASRQREARLRQARRLLLPKMALSAGTATGIEPAELARCPQCGSVRRVRGELLPRVCPFVCRSRSTPASTPASDTS